MADPFSNSLTKSDAIAVEPDRPLLPALPGLSLSVVPAQAGIQQVVEKAGYPFSPV
jgi:hypothetical protein